MRTVALSTLAVLFLMSADVRLAGADGDAPVVQVAPSLRSDTILAYEPAMLRVFCNGHQLNELRSLCDAHVEQLVVQLAIYDRVAVRGEPSCGPAGLDCTPYNVTLILRQYLQDASNAHDSHGIVCDRLLLNQSGSSSKCSDQRYLSVAFTCETKPVETTVESTYNPPITSSWQKPTSTVSSTEATALICTDAKLDGREVRRAEQGSKVTWSCSDQGNVTWTCTDGLWRKESACMEEKGQLEQLSKTLAAGVNGSVAKSAVQLLASLVSNASDWHTETALVSIVAAAGSLLQDDKDVWNELDKEKPALVAQLLDTVDQVGFLSLSLTNDSDRFGPTLQTERLTVVAERIALASFVNQFDAEASFNDAVRFQSTQVAIDPARIANNQQLANNDSLQVVYAYYMQAQGLFSPDSATASQGQEVKDGSRLAETYELGTAVLGVRVKSQDGELEFSKWGERAVVRWTAEVRSGAIAQCAYWQLEGYWSTAGCWRVSLEVLEGGKSRVVCECSHLTSFAVLVDYSGASQRMGEPHTSILFYISVCGCAISSVSLALSLVVLLWFRQGVGQRSRLHVHVCGTLLGAQTAFLAGALHDFGQYGAGWCAAAGAVLHYLLLAAFGWFAAEGIWLCVALVRVFEGRRGSLLFRLVCASAYGVPGAIVAVTAGLWPQGYAPVNGFCWLQAEGGFVWAFVGPLCAVLAANSAAFGVAVAVICRRPRSATQTYTKAPSRSASTRRERRKLLSANASAGRSAAAVPPTQQLGALAKWCKTTFVLANLLGLTWALGLLYFGQETLVFAYLFTIINSLQGFFLFLLYIAFDRKVVLHMRNRLRRSAAYERFRRSRSRSSASSQSSKRVRHTSRQNKSEERTTKLDSGISVSVANEERNKLSSPSLCLEEVHCIVEKRLIVRCTGQRKKDARNQDNQLTPLDSDTKAQSDEKKVDKPDKLESETNNSVKADLTDDVKDSDGLADGETIKRPEDPQDGHESTDEDSERDSGTEERLASETAIV